MADEYTNNIDIDKENLLAIIEDMPNQLLAGWQLAESINLKGNFHSIVLSGMGGSALAGELLKIYLDETVNKIRKGNPLRVIINRSYSLPPEAFELNCLNIISSYSGNTEETLSVFEEVRQNNLTCLGLTSGGKLLEFCLQNKLPFIQLPAGIQPRMGLGYGLTSLLRALYQSGLIEDQQPKLEEVSLAIKNQLVRLKKNGQEIAVAIQGKTPVVYAPVQFKALALIWKIMFNENSKTPAFWNYFPELNHNEMVGFTNSQANFHLLLLKDEQDNSQNLKRYLATTEILQDFKIGAKIIEIPEGEILYRLFATLQIGCFASYYLAINYGQDPTPVEMVERFKSMLK